jgi:ParB family chromosome partitioning protein
MNSNIGKGLSELLGSSYGETTNNDASVQKLELSLIKPGRYQPRMHFDESELTDLSNSISEQGVLQPILVRQNLDNSYEIIAGERRYRASIQADLERIPAIILDIDEKTAYEIAIIENIQREKLNALEEAIAIDKLIKKYEYSQEEIAFKLGKSRTHITNMLRLLNLPQEIQDMLSSNQISMGHARSLVNKDNAIEFARKIVEDNLSVRETEKFVKKSLKKTKNKELDQFKTQKQKYLNEIAYEASQLIDMDVKLNFNGKKGSFAISFKNKSDIDYIMSILKSYNS